MDEIETKIKQALNKFLVLANNNREQYNGKSRIWTKGIFENLIDIGLQEGYKIRCCGYDTGWLYDLVWYKENDKNRLKTVDLVVESEWIPTEDEIKYDFEKLLVANSKAKLMICWAHSDNIDIRMQYFKDAINDYESDIKDEKYLIAILHDNIKETEKWAFKFEVLQRNHMINSAMNTITVGENLDDEERMKYIKDSIEFYKIAKISVENSSIKGQVNIKTMNRQNCLLLIGKVKPLFPNVEFLLGDDTSNIVTLWI